MFVKKIFVSVNNLCDTVHLLIQASQLETGSKHGKSKEYCPYQRVLDTFLTHR